MFGGSVKTSEVFIMGSSTVNLGFIFCSRLRVCLVGGVKRYEDRKWWDDRKVGE